MINFVPLHVFADSGVYFVTDMRVIEKSSTDAYRRGTGDDELQRILGGTYTTLPDNWNIVLSSHFVNLLNFEQGNRFNGWSR